MDLIGKYMKKLEFTELDFGSVEGSSGVTISLKAQEIFNIWYDDLVKEMLKIHNKAYDDGYEDGFDAGKYY